jgi:hypothetical protein
MLSFSLFWVRGLQASGVESLESIAYICYRLAKSCLKRTCLASTWAEAGYTGPFVDLIASLQFLEGVVLKSRDLC